MYYAASSAMAVVGAVSAYFVATEGSLYHSLALAFAAATFIYVSLEDAGALFKSMHPPAERLRRLALIGAGVAVVLALPKGH